MKMLILAKIACALKAKPAGFNLNYWFHMSGNLILFESCLCWSLLLKKLSVALNVGVRRYFFILLYETNKCVGTIGCLCILMYSHIFKLDLKW